MTVEDKNNNENLENKEEKLQEADDIQNELDAALAKADEYLDSLQRERASFANYKRRVDQENAALADRVVADQVKIFLPVVDDLERALNHPPSDPDCANWIAGIDLIRKKLLKTLEAQNVTVIDLKPGDQFDPINQEAVTHEENDQFSDGEIIEVLQTGYQLKDKIIRPALVRVAK
ncbi:MAG: nucleotide exchange factor GrpE [Anaerolineaceae bacterium]|jgi:molecular chaperone GrpE|nr:nucleotide exchange factor GrpE [Anaerolineaceae bacterium]